jgi:hypothetical protein
MSNPGIELRDAVAAHLQSSDCIASLAPRVEVLAFDPGSSEDVIARRLTSPGISVVVTSPDAGSAGGDDRRRVEFTFSVAVGERALHNRGPSGTQVAAYDLAWLIVAALDGYRPTEAWRPVEFLGLEQAQGADRESRDLLVTELRFRSSARLVTAEPEEVA